MIELKKWFQTKWNVVNDQSNENYDAGNKIIYSKEVAKDNLCDYNSIYILVSGDIFVVSDNGVRVLFKNCVPFIKCIKILMEQN